MRIGLNLLRNTDSSVISVLNSVANIDKKNEYLFLYYNPTRKKIEAFKNSEDDRPVIKRSWIYDQISLPFFAEDKKLDLLFSPTSNISLRQPCKTAVCIDEIFPFLLKIKKPKGIEGRLRFFFKLKSIKKANRIIVNSNYAKKITSKALKIDESRISAIFFPPQSAFVPVFGDEKIDAVRQKFGINGQYFVCTFSDDPALTGMIEIFNSCLAAYKDCALVVTGHADHKTLDIYKNSCKNIIFTGEINDHDLNLLYCGSIALVDACEEETRCLDQLNAMACATPVIAFDSGAMPEILGNAGILIKTGLVKEYARAMKDIKENLNLRLKIKALALQRAKLFSREMASASLIKMFEEINNDNYRPDTKQ